MASDTADTVEPSSNPDAATSFMRSGRVPLFSILHADADGPTTVPSAFTTSGTFEGTLNAMFSTSSAYACRIPMPPKKANKQIATARAARMLIVAGWRQEAISDMKEDSRLIGKTGTHRSKKIARYRVKYIPHVAENDMRGGGERMDSRIYGVCFACDRKCREADSISRIVPMPYPI